MSCKDLVGEMVENSIGVVAITSLLLVDIVYPRSSRAKTPKAVETSGTLLATSTLTTLPFVTTSSTVKTGKGLVRIASLLLDDTVCPRSSGASTPKIA